MAVRVSERAATSLSHRPDQFYEAVTTARSTGYVLSDDETEALARRNARLMIRQGAEPKEVERILRRDLRSLGLCPGCGAPVENRKRTTCSEPCARRVHAAKLSARLRGQRLSAEHRAAIGRGTSGKLQGRKLTDEHRAKIGAAQRGRKHGESCSHCQAIKKGGDGWRRRFAGESA